MDHRKFSDKLRQEREGAENVLRDSRVKTDNTANAPPDKKRTAQRRQIRNEATAAKARKNKLRDEHGKATKAAKDGEKPAKPKKPSNAVSDTVSGKVHQAIHNADEDNNSGTEAAHFSESVGEGAVRTGRNTRYSQKLKQYKKLQQSAAQGNQSYVAGESAQGERTGSNIFSRWKQRQNLKKEYAAARSGASAAEGTKEVGAEAVKRVEALAENAVAFVESHIHEILLLAAAGLLVVLIFSMFSSCSAMMTGGGNLILGTSYTAEKKDIRNVEQDYCKLEEALQKKINNIESTNTGYDEYRYNLDEIGHDPYELASLLTVEYEDYTRSEVQERLQTIFAAQYKLTLSPTVEIRTRTETRVAYQYDPITGGSYAYTYQVQVKYEYKILTVTLKNNGIDKVARTSGLNKDLLERYEVLLETRGNRDDLFEDVPFAVPEGADEDHPNGQYTDYDIPGEALTDEKFRNMITEAEKYLGKAYVWGGSSPETGFDCSGYVSWVINHCGNGWNVGRQTANGLMSCCDIIPKSEAQPGDLIFFEGTYNTTGASHVGIYVGNGMMIHCGNPISYTSIEKTYWQEHYYCMGRIR